MKRAVLACLEAPGPAPAVRGVDRTGTSRTRSRRCGSTRSRVRSSAREVDVAHLLEDRLQALGDRLRAVEVAFGKVDQRLETLERTVLPAPADD